VHDHCPGSQLVCAWSIPSDEKAKDGKLAESISRLRLRRESMNLWYISHEKLKVANTLTLVCVRGLASDLVVKPSLADLGWYGFVG
jgi:predicted nucleic acid-binding Zn ribbon protein